jgi:hypothetical protein
MERKNVIGYTRDIVIGIGIAVIIQGAYDSLNIFYGGPNEQWWIPIVISIFIVACIGIALAVIWFRWGKNKTSLAPTINQTSQNNPCSMSITKLYVEIKTKPIYEIRKRFVRTLLYVHGYHYQISVSIKNIGDNKFLGGKIVIYVLFAFGQFKEKMEADVLPIDIGQTVKVSLDKEGDKWGVLAQGHSLFLAEVFEKTATNQSLLVPCERVNCPSQTFASQYRSIPIYNIDSKLIEKQEKGYHVHSFYSLSRGESYTLTALYISIFSLVILNFDKITAFFRFFGFVP